ncbi:MAG: RNA methyltransferase [Porphyromonadaceae bacterium]|nr:RNA methyltransferase [Porphyromonadaceae bacterium]
MKMLSKSQIKLISSLRQKKFRDKLNLFVAEGEKIIFDLAKTFRCKYLISSQESLLSLVAADQYIKVNSDDELKQISSLSTPHKIIAVFEKPVSLPNIDFLAIKNKLVLAVDSVQDTGNFGTIIRVADWYGIDNIVCSNNTVDVFNPKTVQATMGALANVNITYTDLFDFLVRAQTHDIPIYGTFLYGNNIYRESLETRGIVVVGNEGNGISDEIANIVTNRLTIPNFSNRSHKSESLNVAIATAIVCSEFCRYN